MKRAVIGASIAIALLAVSILPVQPAGPSWQDADHGHASIVQQLANERPVHILEAAVAGLPGNAKDATLFLFPTHRQPSGAEQANVDSFVRAGGHAIIAGDGGWTNHWLRTLEVPGPLGLPVHAMADGETACLPVTEPAYDLSLCLPSPSAFSTDRIRGAPNLNWVARSTNTSFLDLTDDGRFGLDDQGGQPLAVAYQMSHGTGLVTVIADADVWRQNAPGTETNQLTALALATSRNGTVYFDSTGDATRLIAGDAGLHAIAAPSTLERIGTLGVAISIVVLLLLSHRATPWHPHLHPQSVENPQLEAKILEALQNRSKP